MKRRTQKKSRSIKRTSPRKSSKSSTTSFSTTLSTPTRLSHTGSHRRVALKHYDVVVLGGGIAGASAALGVTRRTLSASSTLKQDEISATLPNPRVLVVDKESDFCFHSTGRSAAIYSEVYGSPAVRVLSTATKKFYYEPVQTGLLPDSYEGSPLVTKRSSLWVASKSSYDEMIQLHEETKALVPSLIQIPLEEALQLAPALRYPTLKSSTFDYKELADLYGDDDGDYTPYGALLEQDAADMDVNAIYSAMTKAATLHGAEFKSNLELFSAKNNRQYKATDTPQWTMQLKDHSSDDPDAMVEVTADVVINAGGPWADDIAEKLSTNRVGLEPRIRTVIQFLPHEFVTSSVEDPSEIFATLNAASSSSLSTVAPNTIENFDKWPNVFDMKDRYYFKPDAGRVLASPCDEILSPPMDVQPDELSIAVCVERLQRASFFAPQHILHKWAGLRTFTKDREFVIGADGNTDNLLWIAGLGGYGIQTALGNARVLSGLYHQGKIPQDLVDLGLDHKDISPARFNSIQESSMRSSM